MFGSGNNIDKRFLKTQGGARSGSLIHGGYSNWHYGLRERDEKYKILYLSDIDRLWIEVDPKSQRKIVGVIDIQRCIRDTYCP